MTFDATDEKALRSAGIQDVDVAVISIGETVEASVLVAMLVIDLGIRTVIAKAITPLHGRILERLGVSRVIFPERDMAIRVAHSLVVPNVIDFIELSHDFSIVELPAPADFVGRDAQGPGAQAEGRAHADRDQAPGPGGPEKTIVAPAADDLIEAGDVLSLLGPNDWLSNLEKLMSG